MICNLCPRKCFARREEREGAGFCGLGTIPKVARIAPHMWEEPCLSGKNGSGAVFFSGCTMRCVFCQNHEISAGGKGSFLTASELADEFKRLESLGVHNINLVSPTPYVPSIVRALGIYRPSVPIVYNSSGYESVETLKTLEGLIDIYLPDFKYADDSLAQAYSQAEKYTETAESAITEMLRQTGSPRFDDDGMMRKGVIIRHLVLPNHTKNSIAVLEKIAERFGGALVSLMGQYTPVYKAKEHEKLNRKITAREYEKVKQRLFELDLDGFVQELSSADERYIPDWDYPNSNR